MCINKSYKRFFILFILFIFATKVFSHQIKTGIYGLSQFPIAEAADYFINSSGGGINAEMCFSNHIGGTIRVQYSNVIPKGDRIISAWQLTELLGILYEIPLGSNGFSFQPAIEFGLMYQGAKTNDGYGKLSHRAYTDFIFQICPSFRYKNEKLLNKHIEIELSPLWTLIPEKTIGMSFIGARLGITYIFDL